MRRLVLTLLIFASGALVGAWYNGRSHVEIAVPSSLSPELLAKFQELTAADLEEYYRLKTAEDKYLKADEILGKVMAIFLADLGLHASQNAISASRSPPPSLHPLPPPEPRAIPLPAPKMVSLSERNRALFRTEQQLENSRDVYDESPLLRRLKLDDFNEQLRAATRFTNPRGILSSIVGQFAGQAAVTTSGRRHNWDVTLEFQGTYGGGKGNGSSRVRMREGGKEFSDFSLRGDFPGVRQLNGDPMAILVQANSNTYFQLYYVHDLDQLTGNVYQTGTGAPDFSYVGVISLRRN
ncbi:MAG: hypothetical protein ACXVCG_22710 [Bdellovibrionota bacterium]